MNASMNFEDKVLFLSFVGPSYSRSSTILNANSEKFIKQFQKVSPGILSAFRDLYSIRKAIRQASCIVIMSPCHILTPVVKILVKRPVILDAGWALTDGQLSRGGGQSNLLRIATIFMVDFLAFHSADLILMESQAQVQKSQRKFLLPKSKMRVSLTGLNENAFKQENLKSDLIDEVKKKLSILNNEMVVLFRGKINNESGFDNINNAAIQLNNKVSFIFLLGESDMPSSLSPNVIWVSGVSDMEMRQIYELADISLGQISHHPRLSHTIPHKAFEAGFFGTPYISAENAGICEFLDSDDAVFVNEPFTEELVDAINLLSDLEVRNGYAGKINKCYQERAAQSIVNQKFETLLEFLISAKENIGD